MARPEKVRLGDLLVINEFITQEQLDSALEQQKHSFLKLGRLLVQAGWVSESQISEMLAKQFNIPFLDIKHLQVDLLVMRRLTESDSRRLHALPLEERNGRVLVGMTDPTDLSAQEYISRLLKKDLDVAVITEGQLLETIDRVFY
jgi:MSHA biogenesis protein MshE